jgi:replicative DNA helicase
MISAPSAEKAVLGSWLIEKEAISACIDILAPEAFAEQQNAAIARIILELYRQGKAVDMVTVGQAAQEAGISFPGFGTYLADLAHSCTTAAHASHYAKKVLDCFYTRQLIAAAKAVTDKAETETLDEPAVKALSELVMRKEAIYSEPVDTCANGFYGFLDDVLTKSKTEIYKTGIPQLDVMWKGIGGGEICILGAGPGVGKSTIAANFLLNFGKAGIPTLYYGTEETPHQTKARLVSMVSGVEPWRFRIGVLDMEHRRRAHEAIADKIHKYTISISRQKHPSLADIDNSLASGGYKILVLDSLMFVNFAKGENMRLRVQQFMVDLNSVAQKRNVAVFLVCHLGRQTYGAQEVRPTRADLPESNALERVAHKILLVWRPSAKQPANGDRVLEVINEKDRFNPDGQTFDVLIDSKTRAIKEAVDAAV